MEDYAAKGDAFERKAEKKLAGWKLFGSKQDDAADLYDKAANQFKLAKRCSGGKHALPKIVFGRYHSYTEKERYQFREKERCQFGDPALG
ncbi:Alpha-soluble NSF attachment protein [Carex littledalei]|uniref:Alpha-soluble NSF attachment protein n=1 Tax=Carex littledalei TaxID=544730 RepID=A0A833V5M6_9POAL|nr:Alpha-soluble NSF attachment protein [Carex littledalei]